MGVPPVVTPAGGTKAAALSEDTQAVLDTQAAALKQHTLEVAHSEVTLVDTPLVGTLAPAPLADTLAVAP